MKRTRKQTERFGNTTQNKDHHFLETSSEESGPSDEHSQPETNVDKSLKTNDHINTGLESKKQMCRIEAKIDEVLKSMQQMRISVISSSIAAGAVAQIEKVTELPVATPEALDQLESDLKTPSYRKKTVSMN